jgi:polar amino acid transport system substrate-binding protein
VSPRTRSALLAAAAALLLVAGACSSDDGESTDTTAADGGGSELTLVNDGQLTVCSDMPYEPFEFEEDGETKGFDYEVVAAMGDELGLETEFVTTPFDTIIPALVAGNCDMIASAMTITDERAEQVDFTAPYFDADQSLLVLAENAERFATLEDLAGERIGVQVETTGASYANENTPEGATIVEFQTGDELFPALISGDISAALQDFPVNGYRAATDPEQFVVTETFPTGEQYGFAVSKDNPDLLAALDEALATIRDNGTYDAIFATWFGENR